MTNWHVALVPLYMAIGQSGVVITLRALLLGANILDVSLMAASAGTATIVFSTLWGRLSDWSGQRKIYLKYIFSAIGLAFLLLGLSESVSQLILLNVFLAILMSGIASIARPDPLIEGTELGHPSRLY